MTNTDDATRVKRARMALMSINALDQRRKNPRSWDDACATALREAEAVVNSTPPRLLLQVYRAMREGPLAHDPCGEPTRDTNEVSRRPTRDAGLYETGNMQARSG